MANRKKNTGGAGEAAAAAMQCARPLAILTAAADPSKVWYGSQGKQRLLFLDIGNDPSAGSPTETLLRLLLPLNDQV